MKKFLLIILCFFGIPLLLLLGFYLWTDPFRTLNTFDIHDIDGTNREYQTVELYKRNKSTYDYNAFVFGSSQASGLNTYTWKMYLPEGSQTFLFQSWSENITGVKQKVEWLDRQGEDIEHALILIDIPGFFTKEQIAYDALSMKHWELTGESSLVYHWHEYYNFIQKPSSWISYGQKALSHRREAFTADTITNDWFVTNATNYDVLPPQDSLNQCTGQTRRNFFAQISNVSEANVVMSKPLIDEEMEAILQAIANVFEKQGTDYYIIITPAYRYVHPYTNTDDLAKMQMIFGADKVYDYTTDVRFTSDYYDFFDPVHFGTRLGYQMLEDIYQCRIGTK